MWGFSKQQSTSRNRNNRNTTCRNLLPNGNRQCKRYKSWPITAADDPGMKTTEFKKWLSDRIDELDAIYALPFDAEDPLDRCAAIVEKAADYSARLGIADLHRKANELGAVVGPMEAKTYLAECLGALPASTQTLDATELATLLGVTVRSVWRRRADGTLPSPIKIGRSVRWNLKEVEHWLESN